MTLLVRLETEEEGSLRREAGLEAAREVFPHLWRTLSRGAIGDRQFVETVYDLDPQVASAAGGCAAQQEAA